MVIIDSVRRDHLSLMDKYLLIKLSEDLIFNKEESLGKLIVKEVFKMIKKSNHLNRLITLSPLTEMARNFHLNNRAVELQVNEETQNFEYKF